MKPAHLLLLPALLSLRCASSSCHDGTIRAALSFPSAGDSLDVTVALPGRTLHAQATLTNQSSGGSLDIDLAANYVPGAQATITLTLLSGGQPIASASRTTTLAPGCSVLSLELLLAGADLAPLPLDLRGDLRLENAADLAGADLAGADLSVAAVADLSTPADLTTAIDLAGDDFGCGEGMLRCQGDVQQQCQGGAWIDQQTCALWCSGGSCANPPSCSGLAVSCGPGGSDNCCESPLVPDVTFERSYDGVNSGFTDPSFVAGVSSFRLDRYEVTVGRFRQFLVSGHTTQANPPAPGIGAHPLISGSGWDASWSSNLPADLPSLKSALHCDSTYATWIEPAGSPSREALPLNCLSWYEAFAFCAWDGGRLPTEAEWNAAAAGGDQQRAYPFGASVDSSYASYQCGGDGVAGCTFADIQAVGSRSTKGDGRWGHADLSGNLAEWVLDWFASYTLPCNDCALIVQGSVANRVTRGGDFASNASDILSSVRAQSGPSAGNATVGFRCARAP